MLTVDTVDPERIAESERENGGAPLFNTLTVHPRGPWIQQESGLAYRAEDIAHAWGSGRDAWALGGIRPC